MLCFGLPMGSPAKILPVGGFPFDDDRAWRLSVDSWLGQLGERTFERGIPKERWVGYLLPSGPSLAWYPPNRGYRQRVIGREARGGSPITRARGCGPWTR